MQESSLAWSLKLRTCDRGTSWSGNRLSSVVLGYFLSCIYDQFSKKRSIKKRRAVGVRTTQEMFLNSTLGLFLYCELFYTMLAYLEGPESTQYRKFKQSVMCMENLTFNKIYMVAVQLPKHVASKIFE